jgi:sugar phosphate isomerase/epimerase
MWKIAFATLGCPNWDLPTIARRAAEYGYDGVELRGVAGQHVAPDLTLPERTEVRRLFADHGVEIAGIMAYTRFAGAVERAEQRRQEETLVRFVELAADLGAPVVRTFGGDLPKEGAGAGDWPSAVARVAESLNNCAPAAEDHGVAIALETHDAFSLGAGVADVLAVVPSPAVGALWDLLHPFRHGEAPEETAALLRGRVKHVHAKDGRPHSPPVEAFDAEARGGESGRPRSENSGPADWALVEVGKGSVPTLRMLQLLLDGGYDGYISLEWEKQWHPELAEPEEAFPSQARVLRGYLTSLASP